MAANPADVEDFINKVDEVSAQLQALQDGTLDVDAFDRREAAKERLHQREEEERLAKQKKKEEEITNYEERKEKAQGKVDEIMQRRAKKEKARKKFEKYQARAARENPNAAKSSTDYNAWDLWCPSDEEDDMIKKLPPSGAEFKAMEKDIDERHARIKAKERTALKYKDAGNRAFKAGQYSEAYKNYEQGLDADKKIIEMQCNAAMASIKMGCAVQAIEHCDQVMRLAEFFLEKPNHPMVFKALQRRATANSMLKRYHKSVEDLERAVAIEPDNKELKRQFIKAQSDAAEAAKEKELRKAVRVGQQAGAAESGTADGDPASADLQALSKVEKLTTVLKPKVKSKWNPEEQSKPSGDDDDKDMDEENKEPQAAQQKEQTPEERVAEVLKALQELHQLVKGSADLSTYARSCGALKALTDHVAGREAALWAGGSSPVLVPALEALTTACDNDYTRSEALAEHEALRAVVALLAHEGAGVQQAACALLAACSTALAMRKAMGVELARQEEALRAVVALLARADAPALQLTAITLAGNCALEAPMRAGLKAASGDGGAGFVQSVVALLEARLEAVVERAANLLANLCGDKDMLVQIAEKSSAVASLVQALPSPAPAADPKGLGGGLGLPEKKKKAPKGQGPERAFSVDVVASVLAALVNCVVASPGSAEAVVRAGGVGRLAPCLEVGGGNIWVLGRAAALAAKVARLPQGVAQLRGAGVAGLVRAGSAARQWQLRADPTDKAARQAEEEARVQAVESAARALAVVVNVCGEAGQDVCESGGLRELLEMVADDKSSDALVGNAALCVGDCAKLDGVLKTLVDLDAVAKLIPVAHKRKGVAQKNAAIAMARMSRHPPLLERLRDLHGIEIMHSYVKM